MFDSKCAFKNKKIYFPTYQINNTTILVSSQIQYLINHSSYNITNKQQKGSLS